MFINLSLTHSPELPTKTNDLYSHHLNGNLVSLQNYSRTSIAVLEENGVCELFQKDLHISFQKANTFEENTVSVVSK